jgi:hypothetical protein
MTTPNIVPNVDAVMKVDNITNLWNLEISQKTRAIFQYNGPQTPEVTQLISDVRQRLQEVNEYLSIILTNLPSNLPA